MTSPASRRDDGSPPLRVGFLTDATEVAGAEIALATLLKTLDRSVQASVIGVDPTVVDFLVDSRPGSTGTVVSRPSGLRDLPGIWQLRSTLRSLELDILQANLTSLHSCREGIAAALTIPSVRVVAVEHLPVGGGGIASRASKSITSRLLDGHIAVGEGTARAVERFILRRPGAVEVIRNGVLDPVNGSSPTSSAAHRAGPCHLGCLARLDPVKGIDVLLEAMTDVPGARLTIAGKGGAGAALERQSAELGLQDRVTFRDWIDSPWELLRTLDIFVLPSRAEGLPLTVLEAMFAGLPVVATDVGSVREAVDDGRTGFIVPPDDPSRLAAALRDLVGDPGLRAQLGSHARQMAQERFTADRMAGEYERVYARLVPRSRSMGRFGARHPGKRSRGGR